MRVADPVGRAPKAIQERLGHSDIGVTLNLYGHLFPSLEEHLTDALDDLWQESNVRRRDTPATRDGQKRPDLLGSDETPIWPLARKNAP